MTSILAINRFSGNLFRLSTIRKMKKIIVVTVFVLLGQISFVEGQGMGGASTGEARTYTTKRTTGITDAKAPKIFEDLTTQSGLANFRCTGGGKD